MAGKPYDAKAEQRLELVRAAVEPMAYLQAVAIYPYLLGASELFKWADERGYDLSLSDQTNGTTSLARTLLNDRKQRLPSLSILALWLSGARVGITKPVS